MDSIRNLIARWQFKQQWDFVEIPGSEEFDAYAEAVFAAASGDGAIAPQERSWIIGYFASLGMPEEGIARLKNADPTQMGPAIKRHLHAFLDSPAGPFNRGLVYDCIRAAGADADYDSEESVRVHEIADELGIPDAVTDQIEDICRAEKQMKADKLHLFYPDGIFYSDPPAPGTPGPASVRDITAAWHFEEEWGFLQVPQGVEFATYGRAVLAAASADGVLAPDEREWIVGYFASIGAPEELLQYFDSVSPSDVAPNVDGHLQAFSQTAAGPFNRGLIYDCIRAASADGELTSAERERYVRLAGDLGIDDSITEQIERAYQAESASKARRLALFFPEGTPYSVPA
ncbi:MAG: hypothetical protein E6G66_03790 [Actinobacteria bacterium]|nr:MAG: hypothetical protein E6G66_03790 [Actinomycetota bacterium]